MKNYSRVLSVSLFMVAMFVFGQITATAQSSGFRAYQRVLDDGNRVEIIYSPESKKIGVIIKDSAQKWVGGYIIQDVENTKGTFYLSSARKFGNTDDSLFVTIKLGKFREDSVIVRINNKSSVEFQKDYSEQYENLRPPYGTCSGACLPQHPEDYDWSTCFWCCFNRPGQCT